MAAPVRSGAASLEKELETLAQIWRLRRRCLVYTMMMVEALSEVAATRTYGDGSSISRAACQKLHTNPGFSTGGVGEEQFNERLLSYLETRRKHP